ncbi:hypothetical protein CTI12_AA348220 [Artemisia annua]|uniref:Uncharacterized protein n=1 Tax=Artemisia annua TaxID=35608 RepID=A0A2U1MN50_ARTAN|nr:hypothetical protein CTI12_AA348220 [Artemisia annua]
MSGIEQKQMFQEMRFISSGNRQSRRFQYVVPEVKSDVTNEYDSDFVEECSDDSCDSLESLSSSGMVVHYTSYPNSWHNCLSTNTITYNLCRRGLSKYYQGKSESFGSLANLNNIEDLAKKSHKSRRLTKSPLSPKSIITKNKKSSSSYVARSSFLSSLGKMSSLLDIISVQNF